MAVTLPAAVIGCGRMGAFTSEAVRKTAPACWFPLSHAEAIRAHPRLELVALADHDSAMLHRGAEAHHPSRTFTSSAALLAEVQPALVTIATRTPGRADLIQDVLSSRTRALHVEKPLCNSVEELSRLRMAFALPGTFVTYGAIRRFLTPYRQALAIVESGAVGPLRQIHVGFGTGRLFWTHPHSIDLVLFAAGDRRVVGVQGFLAEVERPERSTLVETDPIVRMAAVHFEDGVVGLVSQAPGGDFVLSCDAGDVRVRADGASVEVWTPQRGGYLTQTEPPTVAVCASTLTGTLAPLDQLVSCHDRQPAAVADNARVKMDILRGQEILFALVQSHLEGSRLVDPSAVDARIHVRAITGGRSA